jgi:hypothetical protein
MFLGFERGDTVCKAVSVAPTLMPSIQELLFTIYVQEFISHDDDCVSLALEYFASLRIPECRCTYPL